MKPKRKRHGYTYPGWLIAIVFSAVFLGGLVLLIRAAGAQGYYERQTWADRALGRALPARNIEAADAYEPVYRRRVRAYTAPRVYGYRAATEPESTWNECASTRRLPAGTICAGR